MAAKSSSASENVPTVKLECGMCKKPYCKPKLLKCFHVFCEQCLQSLVCGDSMGQRLVCPGCHQEMYLPVEGVHSLPDAININHLFETQEILQKLRSGDKIVCNVCKKDEAVSFCSNCGFVCQRNVTTVHNEFEKYSTHTFVNLDSLFGDVTAFSSPKKKPYCSNYPQEETTLYCKECSSSICQECLVDFHQNHQITTFPKQEKEILNSLQLLEKQHEKLIEVKSSLDAQRDVVIKQAEAVKSEIHTTIAKMQQVLEARKVQLLKQAEQEQKCQLESLNMQQSKCQLQLGNLTRCRDFVEESHRLCSHGEILKVADPLVKQMNDLTSSSVKPAEVDPLAKGRGLRFTHNPQEIVALQAFGRVYSPELLPEKCQASGEGTKVAMRGQFATLSVEAVDREGEAYLGPLKSLICELVTTDGSSRIRGKVERKGRNVYEVSYQPQVLGNHHLHILIEDRHIFNSPFAVTVLPDFTAPNRVIADLKWPWGIAVRETGEVVVAENAGHCISIVSPDGVNKSSFSQCGNGPGELHYPEGLAVDGGGNILVVEYNNHRVQQFSSTGKHLKTVGGHGKGDLEFESPVGITVHPDTHKVYVSDNRNHRIQILNPDLTFYKSFGTQGSKEGEFERPYDASVDSDGNVYVADYRNHRIQVFAADGHYLRQFGRGGKGGGDLELPSGIAVDPSRNIVFVCEHKRNRVSMFSTNGDFIKSFGDDNTFCDAYALTVDKNGTLYISDRDKNCVFVFV